jgi:hypothetical protein
MACWHVAGALESSAARLLGGWRAKTATTWLDGAAALECSGGEATGRQDGVAASKQGATAAHARGERRGG